MEEAFSVSWRSERVRIRCLQSHRLRSPSLGRSCHVLPQNVPAKSAECRLPSIYDVIATDGFVSAVVESASLPCRRRCIWWRPTRALGLRKPLPTRRKKLNYKEVELGACCSGCVLHLCEGIIRPLITCPYIRYLDGHRRHVWRTESSRWEEATKTSSTESIVDERHVG